MRLPIISLVIFAFYFALPGCTNAKSLVQEQSVWSEKFLLLLTQHQFYYLRNSGNKVDKKIIGVEDTADFSETVYYHDDMTFSCGNNNIYLLKKTAPKLGLYSTLDVLKFDKRGKLRTVSKNINMFEFATSISFDWTTKLFYWIEKKINYYSIKVTNESFYNEEYIVHPQGDDYFASVRVYPKTNELFFLSDDTIKYTSTSPSSTVNVLFMPDKYSAYIVEFTIDYATDKIYWIAYVRSTYRLHCANLGNSARPFTYNDISYIEEIEIVDISASNLVAFDSAIYWNEIMNDERKLIYKSGHDKAKKVVVLNSDSIVSFVAPTCPAGARKHENAYDLLENNEV